LPAEGPAEQVGGAELVGDPDARQADRCLSAFAIDGDRSPVIDRHHAHHRRLGAQHEQERNDDEWNSHASFRPERPDAFRWAAKSNTPERQKAEGRRQK
jgi:hypothetical protein